MKKIESRILNAIYTHTPLCVKTRQRNGSHLLPSSILDAVFFGDDCANVRLCDTVIAIIYADSVRINSGGYRTNTTKSRLNAILRSYCGLGGISQYRGVWYIVSRIVSRRAAVPFVDGMSFPRIR
jgi:hypothetical protein